MEKSKIPSNWKVNADPKEVRARVERQSAQVEKPAQILPLSRTQFDQLKKNGLVSGNTKNTPSITVMLDGEEWTLGGRNARVLLQNKNDPTISVLIPNYYEANKNVLTGYAQKAKEYRASERKDDAGMKTFDVADSKEPVGFVELFDGTDKITNSIKGMPEMLSRRYNLQMTPGSRIDGSTVQSPIQALKNQIQKMHDAGIRNFYINISAHGGTDDIAFGEKGSLDPKDLVELTAQFGDSKFTNNTTSCYGGGIGEAMADFRDHSKAEKGRVTMFTQTKADIGNGAASVDQDGYSTAYNVALGRYLMQGVDGNPGQKLSYGEAHLKADQFAKGTSQYDAEVRSSSPGKNSNYTADTGSGTVEGQV